MTTARVFTCMAALATIASGAAYSASWAMTAAPSEPVAGNSPWAPQSKVTITHPEWSKDAVLYQINTRQFTPEGTFKAAQKELPRLKTLGVDILWLMPIHPIGKENRKGTLGSPYSVQNYYAVNPEFGTEADFKAFIDAAHAQGFHVILDLVANHTAWDNALAKQHPDWYENTWDGKKRPTPWWDWSDIIDLDWSKPGVREHVGGAMEKWVREFGVDGFRADVAGYIPLDFWETMRTRLDAIRPVFMLGEVQQTAHHFAAFDATYAWDWHNSAKRIAKGEADPTAFYGYYAENESLWPREAMRMTYIENHDSNAWEGTMRENYGVNLVPMTVLSFTGEGIPLIYNGMEACNMKRLEFFEKDPIDWKPNTNCNLRNAARGPDLPPQNQSRTRQWPVGRADGKGGDRQTDRNLCLGAAERRQQSRRLLQFHRRACDCQAVRRAGGWRLPGIRHRRGCSAESWRYRDRPGARLPPVEHDKRAIGAASHGRIGVAMGLKPPFGKRSIAVA